MKSRKANSKSKIVLIPEVKSDGPGVIASARAGCPCGQVPGEHRQHPRPDPGRGRGPYSQVWKKKPYARRRKKFAL